MEQGSDPVQQQSRYTTDIESEQAQCGSSPSTSNWNTLAGSSSSPAIRDFPQFISHVRQPSGAGLHVQTNMTCHAEPVPDRSRLASRPTSKDSGRSLNFSSFMDFGGRDLPTSRRSMDNGPCSPTSSMSSPALAALTDVTPLPSPLDRPSSPDMWKRMMGRRRGSSGASSTDGFGLLPSAVVSRNSSRKKKAYPSMSPPMVTTGTPSRRGHTPNRSLSEFVPEGLQNIRPRIVTAPPPEGVVPKTAVGPSSADNSMHREEHIGNSRRKQDEALEAAQSLPSPPPSNKSTADDEEVDDLQKTLREQIEVHGIPNISNGKPQHFRAIRQIGTGAFSKVILATDDLSAQDLGPGAEQRLNPRSLVAIKIVSHNQPNTADEERMGISVKREIEILKELRHPCLPRLLAYNDMDFHALLVMSYCVGGDLFELASQQREFLTPSLIQRIFAELVAAVSYLHRRYIIHRDIKLESKCSSLRCPWFPRILRDINHFRRIVQPSNT